jgi:hypothetical protein
MTPLIGEKVLLIITLIFPNYHITETIPFDSNAACQVAVQQQQNPDYGPFRFQVIIGSNNGEMDSENATLLKPEIHTKCETYKIGNQ